MLHLVNDKGISESTQNQVVWPPINQTILQTVIE